MFKLNIIKEKKMDDKLMLMIFGLILVLEIVLFVMVKYLIGYRSGDFFKIMVEVIENFKWLY